VHDLFDGRLTLLVGRRGGAWPEAARRLAATGLLVHAVTVGADVVERRGALTAAYHLGETGAVLVRPDGYVAWRTPAEDAGNADVLDATATLHDAVATALGRARPGTSLEEAGACAS
jgi:hypothetical protein